MASKPRPANEVSYQQFRQKITDDGLDFEELDDDYWKAQYNGMPEHTPGAVKREMPQVAVRAVGDHHIRSGK
jgi:hypothetical protein